MPTVIVKRTSEFSYKLSDYIVIIDNDKVGRIADGETKEFEVGIGRHTISVKLGVVNSPEVLFELGNDSDVKAFQVGSSKYGTIKHPKWALKALGVFIMVLLAITLIFNLPIVYPIFLLVVIIILYYVILGRSYYLSINPI